MMLKILINILLWYNKIFRQQFLIEAFENLPKPKSNKFTRHEIGGPFASLLLLFSRYSGYECLLEQYVYMPVFLRNMLYIFSMQDSYQFSGMPCRAIIAEDYHHHLMSTISFWNNRSFPSPIIYRRKFLGCEKNGWKMCENSSFFFSVCAQKVYKKPSTLWDLL